MQSYNTMNAKYKSNFFPSEVALALQFPQTSHYCTEYLSVIFVSFLSASSFAHAAHDVQTFADNSLSCPNLVFLHPVFCHLVIAL